MEHLFVKKLTCYTIGQRKGTNDFSESLVPFSLGEGQYLLKPSHLFLTIGTIKSFSGGNHFDYNRGSTPVAWLTFTIIYLTAIIKTPC